MADENDQAGSQAERPAAAVGAVAQAGGVQKVPVEPVSSIRPPATVEQARPAPPGDEPDPLARARALRAEADELVRSAGHVATVRVKLEPPHTELHFGGLFVGEDFGPVPVNRLADLEQAARNAGATLTTEG